MSTMREEYWTTIDGHKVAVGDMSEEHVRNTLRMLLRKQRESKAHTQLMEVLLPCGNSHMPEWESDFWADEGRYGTGE